MRVLVTGAYGLIGSACLARLYEAGHDVVAAGRSIGTARRRFPYAQWIEADFLRLRDAQTWQGLLSDIDAVVNCVGVLQDGLRDDVERVQRSGTVTLFDGCARAGVQRLVHISALAADAAGPSAFARTKAAAEAHLQTLALDWVILRPALVLAPAVYGGTAMLRGIAAFPFVVPLVHADARVQVVSLDDVAETVVRAIAPTSPGRVSWDVAHPQVHGLAEIVTALRGWLGFAPRRVLPLPGVVGENYRSGRRCRRLAGMAQPRAFDVVRPTRRRRGRRSAAVDGGDRHRAEKPRPASRRATGERTGSLVRAGFICSSRSPFSSSPSPPSRPPRCNLCRRKIAATPLAMPPVVRPCICFPLSSLAELRLCSALGLCSGRPRACR